MASRFARLETSEWWRFGDIPSSFSSLVSGTRNESRAAAVGVEWKPAVPRGAPCQTTTRAVAAARLKAIIHPPSGSLEELQLVQLHHLISSKTTVTTITSMGHHKNQFQTRAFRHQHDRAHDSAAAATEEEQAGTACRPRADQPARRPTRRGCGRARRGRR
ncbi:unnamed protein product [Lampetra fluviatilis]